MDKTEHINITEAPPASFEENLVAVAKGGGIVYAGKLFLSLSRFITVVLLARILTAEQYGLYIVALSAATVCMGIALFGLDNALVRYIAIYASRRDEAALWRALQVCVGISTVLSVLTSTGLFALAFPIATRAFHKPELAPLLQIASLVIPFLVLSEILAAATRGFKKMHYMVIAQHVGQPVIRFILIVILSLIGLNTTWAIITFGLADGAASVLFLIFLNKHLPSKRPIGVKREDFQTLLGFSLPLWLADLMAKFRGNIQTILLGSFNTITNVGIYGVVSQINLVVQMLLGSMATSAKPMIAELHDRGDYEQMGRLYQTTTKWIVIVNLPVSLTMILFPVPILSIFGKSFVNGAEAMVILAFANLVNIGTGMCGSVIDMTGYSKLKLLNTSLRVLSSIFLNFLLIPIWGLMGAAVAALLVEIIVNLTVLVEIWILFRLLPYNKHFFPPLMAGLGAFAAAFIMNNVLQVNENPAYAIVSFIVMIAVYVTISLGLGLAPEDRVLVAKFQRRLSAFVSRM